MHFLKFHLHLVFVLVFLLANTYAIDLESAKERTCVPIKKTAQVDSKWMDSVKVLYYPLMSRLDLYHNSLEIHGSTEDPTKLRESELYYDSCIKTEFVGDDAIATGFNGKSSSFSYELPTVNEEGVTSQKYTSESGVGMTTYITLTDNASYVFMAVCWDDNQASWEVMSTTATLPEETVKLIHEHAESLGFKKEYFEELRYTNCHDEQANTISAKGSETCTK